ncbi:MAG: protein kinase [Phycisphaerales bacterium]|nr:protein kinase [Phycisphaerales bacterium]
MADHKDPPDRSTPAQDATVVDGPAVAGGASIPASIGPYRVKQAIGSGGMGTVVLAEQDSPRRDVAIKIMNPGVVSAKAMRRFEFEAQTLGRLQHPAIAQIYEAGTFDDGSGGRPFFAMEHVSGARELDEYVSEESLDTRQRLELFRAFCEGVAYGHRRGVIHRDLKPGNILVDAEGHPKIIDFGVARSTDADAVSATLATEAGQLIGTLQYMSPEQVELDPAELDTRSDVYAMGVILYQLLSGKMPYDLTGTSITRAAELIRETQPARLSEINATLRGDLETICLKALEKDRSQRYQSVAELSEDVRRFLSDEPILARPPTRLEQLRRLVRKNKAAAIATVVVAASLVAATSISIVYSIEAGEQRDAAELATAEAQQQRDAATDAKAQADRSAKEALEQRDLARRQGYYGNLHAALGATRALDPWEAQRRLEAARLMFDQPAEQMPFEWRFLAARSDESRLSLSGHEANVSQLDVDDAGEVLASICHGGMVRIWDLGTGEIRWEIAEKLAKGRSIAVSPDGGLVAAGGETIHVFDAVTGERVAQVQVSASRISAIAFHPDGRRLIAVGDENTLQILDPDAGDVEHTFAWPHGELNSIAVSPSGGVLAAGGVGQLWATWDLSSLEPLAAGGDSGAWAECVALSPDGALVAVGASEGPISVWNSRTGEMKASLAVEGAVTGVAFGADGNKLYSAGADGVIRNWDLLSGRELARVHGRGGRAKDLAVPRRGTEVISTSTQPEIQVWGSGLTSESLICKGHRLWINDVAFFPDGKRIATAGNDKTIRIWDAATGRSLAVIEGAKKYLKCMAISPKGGLIAAGTGMNNVLLWDSATGEQVGELGLHDDRVTAVGFSHDGRLLASADADGSLNIWDVDSMRQIQLMDAHGKYVYGLEFSADGEHVFTCGKNESVDRWNVATGAHESQWIGHEKDVTAMAMGADGRVLASCDESGVCILWRVETGDVLLAMQADQEGVASVAFSRCGRRLATGGESGDLQLWDIESGESVGHLIGHARDVNGMAFSPDGSQLATVGQDGTLRVWDSRPLGQTAFLIGSSGDSNGYSVDGQSSRGRRMGAARSRASASADAGLSALMHRLDSTMHALDNVHLDEGKTAQLGKTLKALSGPMARITRNEVRRLVQSRVALAKELTDAGDFAGARWAYLAASRAGRRLGEDDDLTIWSLRQYGEALRGQGFIDEAVPLLQGALEAGLGNAEVSIFTINGVRASLGQGLVDLGKHDEAIALFEACLETYPEVLGGDPGQLAKTNWWLLVGIAHAMRAQGRLEEALEVSLDALKTWEGQHGSGHGEVARSRYEIGQLYLELGRHSDAEAYLLSALDLHVEVFGERSSQIADVLGQVIEMYGDWHEADPGAGHDAQADAYQRRLDAIEQGDSGRLD